MKKRIPNRRNSIGKLTSARMLLTPKPKWKKVLGEKKPSLIAKRITRVSRKQKLKKGKIRENRHRPNLGIIPPQTQRMMSIQRRNVRLLIATKLE